MFMIKLMKSTLMKNKMFGKCACACLREVLLKVNLNNYAMEINRALSKHALGKSRVLFS